jgi:hypothetical protein
MLLLLEEVNLFSTGFHSDLGLMFLEEFLGIPPDSFSSLFVHRIPFLFYQGILE